MNCPDCGHDKVTYSYACHTWPNGTYSNGSPRWMSCQNCDSALRYSCDCQYDDEVPNPDDPDGLWIYREPDCRCQWSYTHGLNPDSPRTVTNEQYRPPWLVGDLEFTKHGFPIPYPDVEYS